jgi:hypothetical protein
VQVSIAWPMPGCSTLAATPIAAPAPLLSGSPTEASPAVSVHVSVLITGAGSAKIGRLSQGRPRFVTIAASRRWEQAPGGCTLAVLSPVATYRAEGRG